MALFGLKHDAFCARTHAHTHHIWRDFTVEETTVGQRDTNKQSGLSEKIEREGEIYSVVPSKNNTEAHALCVFIDLHILSASSVYSSGK